VKSVKNVACVGSGVIGASWATNFAFKGCTVNIYDISDIQLENARVSVKNNLDFLAESGIISKDEVLSILSRINYTTDLKEAICNVSFIQECGPEKYEIKQSILNDIDEYAPVDAVYASSTSGLLISEIAKFSKYPERCVGGHPYNPPHLIPLVEITKGEHTDQKYVDKAVEFYKICGKEPVVLQKEKLGFIANRLSHALFREAVDLVVSGVCSVEDVDKAVTYGPGMRWAILGPNMLYELGGGAGGIKSMNKFAFMANLVFSDIADWKEMPSEWNELGQPGVDAEKINLPDFIGHNSEDISKFRDTMLVELLKLHHKL